MLSVGVDVGLDKGPGPGPGLSIEDLGEWAGVVLPGTGVWEVIWVSMSLCEGVTGPA